MRGWILFVQTPLCCVAYNESPRHHQNATRIVLRQHDNAPQVGIDRCFASTAVRLPHHLTPLINHLPSSSHTSPQIHRNTKVLEVDVLSANRSILLLEWPCVCISEWDRAQCISLLHSFDGQCEAHNHMVMEFCRASARSIGGDRQDEQNTVCCEGCGVRNYWKGDVGSHNSLRRGVSFPMRRTCSRVPEVCIHIDSAVASDLSKCALRFHAQPTRTDKSSSSNLSHLRIFILSRTVQELVSLYSTQQASGLEQGFVTEGPVLSRGARGPG